MSNFTQSVNHYTGDCDAFSVGTCFACVECNPDEATESDFAGESEEGNFSSCQCDSCGSTLAGDRYAAHWLDIDNEIIHCAVCVDCLFYHANGDEPEIWET